MGASRLIRPLRGDLVAGVGVLLVGMLRVGRVHIHHTTMQI